MSNKLQLRRDTAAKWEAANPVLAQGEIGLILDSNGKVVGQKIGDGVTEWKTLPSDKATENAKGIEFLNANTGVSEYPLFDEAKAYAVGEVVLYEGLLKRFTSEHAAGAWDASQVEVWSERKEVAKLKEHIEGREEKFVTVNHTAIKKSSGYSFTDLDTPIQPHTIITSVTKDGAEYSGTIDYKTSSGAIHNFHTSSLPFDTESYDMVSIGTSPIGVYVITHEHLITAIKGLDDIVEQLSLSVNTNSENIEQVEEYIKGKASTEKEIEHTAVLTTAWAKGSLDVKIDKGKDIVGILKDGLPYNDTIYMGQTEGENWSVSQSDLPYNSGSRDAIAIQASTSGTFIIITRETVEGSLSIEEKITRANNLYGKKWAVFGDSFSEGIGVGTLDSGKFKGENKCYPYIIGNRNDMEIQKLFLSGRMITTPTSGDVTNSVSTGIYQQVDEDVNYITLYLGINDSDNLEGSGDDGEDYNRPITLGDINSTDIHTFYGAWNVVLKWLIENRPFAHIGIIVSNGMNSNDTLRTAEIALANKWGIPYIDLNGDERTPMMHRSTNANHSQEAKNARLSAFRISPSNTHPNAMAYEYESTFIENFLKTL